MRKKPPLGGEFKRGIDRRKVENKRERGEKGKKGNGSKTTDPLIAPEEQTWGDKRQPQERNTCRKKGEGCKEEKEKGKERRDKKNREQKGVWDKEMCHPQRWVTPGRKMNTKRWFLKNKTQGANKEKKEKLGIKTGGGGK